MSGFTVIAICLTDEHSNMDMLEKPKTRKQDMDFGAFSLPKINENWFTLYSFLEGLCSDRVEMKIMDFVFIPGHTNPIFSCF